MKLSNIYVNKVPKGERKVEEDRKCTEKKCPKIIKFHKVNNKYVQEFQETMSRINPKKIIFRHITVNMLEREIK